jgi:hypothetical protein
MPQFDLFAFISITFWAIVFTYSLMLIFYVVLIRIKEKTLFNRVAKKVILEFYSKDEKFFAIYDLTVKFFFPKK